MIYLSPLAYQKIITARDFNGWEIGFYGITDADDITRINDVYMPVQECDTGQTEFDDKDVNEYVTKYTKSGYSMKQLLSVWIHTHPGNGIPKPSGHDNETFGDILGMGHSGIMIICSNNHIKAWLQVSNIAGLKESITVEQDVEIDWKMDSGQKFIYENWKKRHTRVVSLLPTKWQKEQMERENALAERPAPKFHGFGYDGSDQCPLCLKSMTYNPCYQCDTCHKIINACYSCWILDDRLCNDCLAKSLNEFEAEKDKIKDTNCDGYCENCRVSECKSRTVDYDPAQECDGDCGMCETEKCEMRDAHPAFGDCFGYCEDCQRECPQRHTAYSEGVKDEKDD
jgi:hypothetical protein